MTTLLPGAEISVKMTLRGNSSFISLVVFRISWLTEVYISRVAIDCVRDVSAAGRHLKAEDTNEERKKKLAFRSCHYKDLTETGNPRMRSPWHPECVLVSFAAVFVSSLNAPLNFRVTRQKRLRD